MLYGMIEDWVYEILSTSLDKKIFYSFSSLIFSSVLGFSANYLYLLKSEKKIAAILSKTSNDEKRIDLLKKTGGTSWVPFILVCVILLSLIIVYNFYY
jgi:ABC-type Fe3+ transport system permease subunit